MRLQAKFPILVLLPNSFCTYFYSFGYPTSPVVALAKECPINGIVPLNKGLKF